MGRKLTAVRGQAAHYVLQGKGPPKFVPQTKRRPPLLKIYPPWSPYRPYRGKEYQRMNPKNYRRKTIQRSRRDAVWIKKMHSYNDIRDDNDHANWLNGWHYFYDDDGVFHRSPE